MDLTKAEMLTVFRKALKEAERKASYLGSKSEYYLTRFQIVNEEVRNLKRMIAEVEKKEEGR